MKKALLKDTIKEITHNFKRFISIMLIVLLGVGFFVGIKSASPDMKQTLDKYFNEQNVMDLEVISTLGLTKEDLQEIEKIEGVEKVVGSYSAEGIVETEEKELVTKIEAICTELNKLTILEGSLPTKPNECAVEKTFLLSTGFQIGDKIKIRVEEIQNEKGETQKLLKQEELTIVGTIESPLYISRERGSTKLGSGKIDYYLYIPQENFAVNFYTMAYIKVENANNLKTYEKTYENTVEQVKNKIEAISEERKQARYDEIYKEANKKIQDAQTKLDTESKKAQNEIKEAKEKLAKAKKEVKEGKEALEINRNSTNKQLKEAKTKLDQAQKEIEEKQKLIPPGNSIAQMQIEEAKKELEKQKAAYEKNKKQAEAELKKAQNKLEQAESKIKENEAKVQKAEKEADEKIQEAQEKLEKAKQDLEKIEKPEWYILTRKQNAGYVSYLQDADRIDNIAAVFPIVFFVVAALTSLTSMTRMVEEQRVQIGTLKALGYKKVQIAAKYIIYASLATFLGSALGTLLCYKTLPAIVLKMYAMMYTIPFTVLEFNINYVIMGSLAAAICTVGATIYSCMKSLKSMPANLMRPKAPKPGKRVFLEKIPFIWSKFNFTKKVTARNIFRYKKRFLMTIVGVAGCTALIIAGFGLRDAIGMMIPAQYGEIFKYNIQINLKDNLDKQQIETVHQEVQKKQEITNSTKLLMKSVEIVKNDNNQNIQLVVPEDIEHLGDFINLQNRKNKQEKYTLNNTGIIITEKLAKMLEIKKGDKIVLKDADKVEIEVKVNEITENYLMHYIYMSPQLYEELYKQEAKANVIVANTGELSEERQDHLGKQILEESNISGVSFLSFTTSIFEEVMSNLGLVVWILIIAAGLLAFVVLYNLSNANISERVRELATIKVLGFYDKEVFEYVAKEMIILTIIGMLFGILGGMFLTTFIIKTCELDMLMFNPKIELLSYIYGLVITAVFAIIVNIANYFALRKIDMIESLKSVE